MSINPRTILELDVPIIKTGFKANLTLFNPKQEFEFNNNNNQSLSDNSPFLNTKLNCKILGVNNGDKYHFNDRYFFMKNTTFVPGKSYTTSSCKIPQDGNIARVCGCSGAM